MCGDNLSLEDLLQNINTKAEFYNSAFISPSLFSIIILSIDFIFGENRINH